MNFDGFQGLVNAVGGIDVNFPDPAKDAFSGLNITKTGCQHLDGAAALSLARSRDFQYFANGSWHFDGEGDLGRIRRQHTFIRILMGKAISAGIHNPITANSLISSAVHDVTIDNKLSTNDILGLAMRFRSLDPNGLVTYTLPTAPAVVGGADVLRLQQPGGTQIVNQFLGKGQPPPSTSPTPPPPAPSSVRVQVLNGSGTSAQASRAATELRSAGFVVAGTGNAAGTRSATSEVLYAPGKQQAAQLLQGRVGGGAGIQQDPALQGADVALVTGTSFSGITPAAAPAPAPAAAPAPAPAALPPFDPRAC
jgi:hypothetical protein